MVKDDREGAGSKGSAPFFAYSHAIGRGHRRTEMSKSVYRTGEAWIVGCGGVCYQALPWLVQTLKAAGLSSVSVWDADRLTEENKRRQWAEEPVGALKAEIVAKHLRLAGVEAYARTNMFEPGCVGNMELHKPEEDGIPLYVFAWPDSNAARLYVETSAWAAALQGWNVLGVTAGNGVDMANAYPLWIPAGGEVENAMLWSKHLIPDEVLEVSEPEEGVSCRTGSVTQTPMANMAAAFLSALAFQYARMASFGHVEDTQLYWNAEDEAYPVRGRRSR